jgi:hypothetical protein
MKLLPTTTTQEHLLEIEKRIAKTNRLVNAAVDALNAAHHYVWSLPDAELTDVLQTLVSTGKFESLFAVHEKSALYFNDLLTSINKPPTAITGAGREFTIENGIVTVIPIPIPEPPIADVSNEPLPEVPVVEEPVIVEPTS